MSLQVEPIEVSITIDAPPSRVWELVGDPRNMPRWSPQTKKSFLRGGVLREGAELVNLNRKGVLVWPTRSVVVAFEPEREVAWRIKENNAVWRFRLEPAGKSTRVVQTREAPEGISDLSVKLTDLAFGGVDQFAEVLEADMATTLGRIKVEAEA